MQRFILGNPTMPPKKKSSFGISAAAKRMRERRKNLSPEAREKLREKTRESVQRHREKLTEEKCDIIRTEDQKRHEESRQNGTESQKKIKRAKDAARKQAERAAESESNKNQRNVKDAEYQRNKRGKETNEEKRKRLDKDAEFKRNKRAKETYEERSIRLSKKQEYQFDYNYINRHDISRKKQKYLDQERDLSCAGSFYQYLISVLEENLEGKEDWKWIDNKVSNEIMMASDFQLHSKKFAVIFKQIGLVKNDIVHFVVDSHNQTFVALGGLWILGAVGSVANKYIWPESQESPSLEINPDQLRMNQYPLNNGAVDLNLKAIICTKGTVSTTKDAIALFDPEIKGKILLLSFGQVEGCRDISAMLKQVDIDKTLKPVKVQIKDPCLIFMNLNVSWPTLCSQKEVFNATKKELTFNSKFDVFNSFKEDLKGNPKGLYLPLTRNIYLLFAALQDRKTFILQNTFDVSIATQEAFQSVDLSCQKNVLDAKSPTSLVKKPYDYSRPKITFTMEDLEHEEDNDSYEANVGIPGTSQRFQPKRGCKNMQNLKVNQSDVSDESKDSTDEESFQDFIDNAVESALDENRENSTEKEYIEDALSTDSDAKVLCNVCKMVFKDSSSLDNHVFESTYCYNYYMQDY